jgi:hypothetical protein
MQFHYRIKLHQNVIQFDSNLTVFDELSNDNQTT